MVLVIEDEPSVRSFARQVLTSAGFQVIEVETAGMFDATTVQSVPGVVSVRQRGPRAFSATVEDAATTLPSVVEAVTTSGAEIESAQEVRPTFDEVFALLVERARAEDPDAALELLRELQQSTAAAAG